MPFFRRSEKKEMPGTTSVPSAPESVSFEGYTTLDGERISAKTEIKAFNRAHGFSPVNDSPIQIPTSKESGPKTVSVEPSEASAVRQQALEMPGDMSGEELVVALEAKQNEFKKYFEEKWKGKMFEENAERDADLECLARLQGRVIAERMKIGSGEKRPDFPESQPAETISPALERIVSTELEQMRTDVVSTQEKLLTELNGTPPTETDARRKIHKEIQRLGVLLKPENEQDLRAWWDTQSELPA